MRGTLWAEVLATGGEDLRALPLSMRKTNLERLLRGRPDGIFVTFEIGAIGPDPVLGWAAIASKKTKPISIERFKEVERSLRRTYELEKD